ncbi:C-type lectin domain family 10 member A isoform X2 [Salmo salar]|uniref:C-type lectin domain family 10 member A isoform X2 n=1 Tax=Salmo salar TaxID=8030 RepID=A0ABM3EMV8_SALSA|nr:C-type lectin domain family 10 member A-like isoform X2 [Salmo salar]
MDDYINEEVIELNEIIEENENIAMRRVKTHRAGPKDSGRTLYRMVAVSFGMLCVLQVTLNISLRLSFSCSDKERDQIKACYNTTGLAQDRDQPNTSRGILGLCTERDQCRKNRNQLERERVQLESERDQLESERDQLESERDQLESERDQLESERDQLQSERDQLKCERDQLEKTNQNQLQECYNAFTKDRDMMSDRVSLLINEKVTLEKGLSGCEKMCPEGWKKFGFNSCYYLSAEKKPWEYAEQDCLGRGAHLVIINSEEEQKFLNALRTISWIGLNERETWK